jgi:hypothetical protein
MDVGKNRAAPVKRSHLPGTPSCAAALFSRREKSELHVVTIIRARQTRLQSARLFRESDAISELG